MLVGFSLCGAWRVIFITGFNQTEHQFAGPHAVRSGGEAWDPNSDPALFCNFFSERSVAGDRRRREIRQPAEAPGRCGPLVALLVLASMQPKLVSATEAIQ